MGVLTEHAVQFPITISNNRAFTVVAVFYELHCWYNGVLFASTFISNLFYCIHHLKIKSEHSSLIHFWIFTLLKRLIFYFSNIDPQDHTMFLKLTVQQYYVCKELKKIPS